MTFLNLALLAGAAAFVVPLVIHLLNRSRFQVVPWAAMHLLEFSLPQNTRRFEWRALLLLLVRCLIPIVLALCMARPLWNWWQANHTGQVECAVVLLDNSISMQAQVVDNSRIADQPPEAAAGTGLQVATFQAGQIAAQGRDDGRFVLIPLASHSAQRTSAAGVTIVPYGSRADLEQAAQSTSSGRDPIDLLRSLQTAIATAQSFRRPASHIVLISDFRASDWERISDDSLTELKRRMQATSPHITLTFLPVPVVSTPNRNVHFVATQPLCTRVGQPIELAVVVSNDSPEECGPLPVVAQVDGADLGTRKLTLPARGQAEVSFLCRFDRPGSHQVEVRIQDTLPITDDDVTRMSLTVLPTLPCLIVDGGETSELLKRESGFLQLALGGPDKSGTNEPRPFAVTAVSTESLTIEQIAAAQIIVLADVRRLPPDLADAIATQVANGTHLVLFPGDQIDRDWYIRTWGPDSARQLLPGTWNEPREIPSADPSVTIREQAWDHPALRIFGAQANNPLGRVEFRKYWPIAQLPRDLRERGDEGAAHPTRGLRDRGYEASRGLRDGGYEASRGLRDGGYEEAADEASRGLRDRGYDIATLSNDEPWLVTRTVGNGHVLQCATTCSANGSNWPLRPSFVPAIQRLLSAPFDDPTMVGDAAARESELTLLSAEQLERIATALGAEKCDSVQGFIEQAGASSGGRELWQPLLWLTVTLLIGEVFLQKYLTRGPR